MLLSLRAVFSELSVLSASARAFWDRPMLIVVVYMGTFPTVPATLSFVASAFMILAVAALVLVHMPEQRTREVEDGVQGTRHDGEQVRIL